MNHLRSILRIYLPLSLIFLFLNAFQKRIPGDNKPRKTSQAATSMLSGIPLDVLSLPVDEFKKIKSEGILRRHIILKPYMEAGRITLHGWVFKKNDEKKDFKKVSYLILKKDSVSSVIWGDSTYMGSQIIRGKLLKNFIKYLDDNNITGDLLFTPKIYIDSDNGAKYVSYRISPRSTFGKPLLDNYLESNPSPPRKMIDNDDQ